MIESTASRGSYRFVGRQRELEVVRAAVERAVGGHGGLVMISGDAGVGKTRLAAEAGEHAERHGAFTLWGRCWEFGGAPPFWPWIEILRGRLRQISAEEMREQVDLGAAAIAQILPEVGAALGDLSAASDLEPEQARFRLFDSVSLFLRRSAARQPLVLVIDDLHAADVPTLLLLRFLARDLDQGRIAILGTFRQDEARAAGVAGELLAECAREGHSLRLAPLARAEVEELVGAIIGAAATPALVTSVYEATEGNPFFLGEFLHSSARVRLAEAARAPASVRSLVRGRVQGLAAGAKSALEVAAVVGREFDVDLVRRVLRAAVLDKEDGDDAADALTQIGSASAVGLVAEVGGQPGRYRFAHGLIVETLYDDLDPSRRRRLHLAVAQAIECSAGAEGHLSALSRHFALAAPLDDPRGAIAWMRRAAERARALLAYEEAELHDRRALGLADLAAGFDTDERCEMLLALGASQWGAGRIEASRATFAKAADCARSGGARAAELRARAALGFGGSQQRSHIVFESALVDLLEDSLHALAEGDAALRARVCARLAYAIYTVPGSLERRAALSRQALELARRCGDPTTLRWTLSDVRWALWGPESRQDRSAISAELMRLAHQAGDAEMMLTEFGWSLLEHLEDGDVATLDADIALYCRRAEAIRLPWYQWYALRYRAMRAALAGRLAEAEDLAHRAFAAGQSVQHPDAFIVFGVQILNLRLVQQRGDELLGSLSSFAAQYPDVAAWRHALALVYSELGREAEARAEFELLAQRDFADLPRDFSFLSSLAFLSQVCAVLGDERRADTLYALLLPYSRHCVVVGNAIACLGSVQHYLGLLAAGAGREREAADHFEAALSVHAALDAPLYLARTQFEYARVLLRADGDDEMTKAHALAAAAVDTYRLLGLDERAAAAEGVREQAAARQGRARAVFRQRGEYWEVAFASDAFRMRASRGLLYIAHLLRHAGQSFHASELNALGRARPAPAGVEGTRRRRSELNEELREAEENHDIGRVELLRRRMAEVEDAVVESLGGQDDGSRARAAVTMAIRDTLRRMSVHSPPLAHHLEAAIRTGRFCTYAPQSSGAVEWFFDESL